MVTGFVLNQHKRCPRAFERPFPAGADDGQELVLSQLKRYLGLTPSTWITLDGLRSVAAPDRGTPPQPHRRSERSSA
jgi:hypothetical protein